jgi:hypothetical protein
MDSIPQTHQSLTPSRARTPLLFGCPMIPTLVYAVMVLWCLEPVIDEIVDLVVDPDTLPYGRRPAGF